MKQIISEYLSDYLNNAENGNFICEFEWEGVNYEVEGKAEVEGYWESDTNYYVTTGAIVIIKSLNTYDSNYNEITNDFSWSDLNEIGEMTEKQLLS